MEDFAGILICCTNLREALDEAALRRFQWKISFLPLLPRYRVELYRRYFDELCGAPDDEVLSLASRLEGLGRAHGLGAEDVGTLERGKTWIR